MIYNINSKNVKQSLSNLSLYLKEKGFNIPHNVMLDGFAKALFLKNWNTLSATMQKPVSIQDIEAEYKYILEIEIDLSQSILRLIIEEAFAEAKATLYIDSFVCLNKDNKDETPKYQIILNLAKGSNNTLTGFMLLGEKFKSIPIIPTNMEFCRIQIQKESFMTYFK